MAVKLVVLMVRQRAVQKAAYSVGELAYSKAAKTVVSSGSWWVGQKDAMLAGRRDT